MKTKAKVAIALLFVVAVLKFLVATPGIYNEIFLGNYQFFSGDSFDWVANGIGLFEHTDISFRNPGLPIIVKFLYSFNALGLIVFVNQLVYAVLLVSIWQLMRQVGVGSNKVRFAAMLPLLLGYLPQLFSFYVLADLYAIVLISVGVNLLFSKRYLWSALCIGVSTLFQNFAFFLVPLWLMYTYKRTDKRRTFRSALVLFAPSLIWWAYKFLVTGDALYTRVSQFELLNVHFDSIGYYILQLGLVFGLGSICLLGYGCIRLYQLRATMSTQKIFLIASLVVTLVFWVVIYQWHDRRFLLYLIPFIMPLGALVLGSIYVRSTLIFSTVAVLLLIPSYFGPPNFFLDERIHLTQNTYYELTKAVDASGLASFSWDGEFKHEGGVFASALPLLKTLINQRQVSGNAYVSHKELLAEIYDHDTKVICVPKDNELDSQILNLVLQIEYGVSLHQLTQLQIC